jgi:hypothetical protein
VTLLATFPCRVQSLSLGSEDQASCETADHVRSNA